MASQPPDTKHSETNIDPHSSRWCLAYGAVIVFSTLVILLLLLFSRHFSG